MNSLSSPSNITSWHVSVEEKEFEDWFIQLLDSLTSWEDRGKCVGPKFLYQLACNLAWNQATQQFIIVILVYGNI